MHVEGDQCQRSCLALRYSADGLGLRPSTREKPCMASRDAPRTHARASAKSAACAPSVMLISAMPICNARQLLAVIMSV
jgi:hypothetical protein